MRPHVRLICFVITVVLLGFSNPATARIYKWVDAEGRVHYSNIPPPGSKSAPPAALRSLARTSPAEPWRDLSSGRDRLAYTIESNGRWDIYTSRIDGSRQRQLTNSAQRELMPTWSPNGEYLAYSVGTPPGPGVWLGSKDLFVMDYDGSNIRQLASDRVFAWYWSPDSTMLTYSTGEGRSGFYCTFKHFTIHVVDVATGRELLSVEDAWFPVWIPVTNRLLFLELSGGSGSPKIASPRIGKVSSLTDSEAAHQQGIPFSASPDGTKIYWIGPAEMAGRGYLDEMLFETDARGNSYREIMKFPGTSFRMFVSDYTGCGRPRNILRAWSEERGQVVFLRIVESSEHFELRKSDLLNIDISLFTLAILDPKKDEPLVAEIRYDTASIFDTQRIGKMRKMDEIGLVREKQIGLSSVNWSPKGVRLLYAVESWGAWFFGGFHLSEKTKIQIRGDVPPEKKAFLSCCGR